MGVLIPKEIEALGEIYEVEMGAGDFVAAHGSLLPFLQELAPALREYFPDGPLRLHLARDPESGRESQLWVFAHPTTQNGRWEPAAEFLEEFDRTWWRANRQKVRGLVAVDIRFTGDE
jgi:hypothetical protein